MNEISNAILNRACELECFQKCVFSIVLHIPSTPFSGPENEIKDPFWKLEPHPQDVVLRRLILYMKLFNVVLSSCHAWKSSHIFGIPLVVNLPGPSSICVTQIGRTATTTSQRP